MNDNNPPDIQDLNQICVWGDCLPTELFRRLRSRFKTQDFARWYHAGFPFYRTTFWYPLKRTPAHEVEEAIQVLREAASPPADVIGVEWWFSVLNTNRSPQWLLPCHFDRADLDEKDSLLVRHPVLASVLFFDRVPYGELVITEQRLSDGAEPNPTQPAEMRFIPPEENRYAVFPGHLYHGVIGRLWREREPDSLRVSMAVNWWTEAPSCSYLRDSENALAAFSWPTSSAS
jgi:hypothetical protein